ncbi:MAG: hypothetical protein JW959_10780 [Pirellulales bacterium]|nr:hypothetical protein [Pirellulales bacterium]
MSKAKPKPKKMGRPPLPADKAKTEGVFVRLTPGLYEAMSEAAKREGLPLATWIRSQAEKSLGSK